MCAKQLIQNAVGDLPPQLKYVDVSEHSLKQLEMFI
jgi:hypothetical protein